MSESLDPQNDAEVALSQSQNLPAEGNQLFSSGTKRKIDAVYTNDGRKYPCLQCDKTFTQTGSLTRHIASVHDGRKYPCLQCDKTFTDASHLRRHIASVHDGRKYPCLQCMNTFTQAGSLTRHIVDVHDQGHKECGICYKMCGRVLSHKFTYDQSTQTGTIDICRQCCRHYGLKKERIEHRYMERLDKYIDFPALDDQMVRGEACFRYRPDRLYLDANRHVYIHIECDEHQHWSMGSYTCEEQRISDIYDEFAESVPDHYVVIRFNPDEYDKNDEDREKVFEERVRHLAEIIQYVRKNPPPEKVSIIYMYYSENNPQIAKNLPVYFVDDKEKMLPL